MRSSKWIFLAAIAMLVGACSYEPEQRPNDEYVIGEKLKDVTSLNNPLAAGVNKVVMHDTVSNRLHQFDLNTMKIERSLPAGAPGQQHTVLYDLVGNYVIDFSNKHMTVFDRYDRPQYNPLQFVGTPVSASFRPQLGLLIVYDTLSSVGMLKFDGDGVVTKNWMGGPILGDTLAVTAGDVSEGGQLVLGMSDGSFAIVDPIAAMNAQAWPAVVPLNVGLADIKWIAPVRGQPDLVLVSTGTSLSVLNIQTRAIVSGPKTVTGQIIKYSKSVDAHVIARVNLGSSITVHYVEGGVLKERTKAQISSLVTHSRLDTVADRWTLILAHGGGDRNVPREVRNREVMSWRWSDWLSQGNFNIANWAKIEITPKSAFVLHPSKLGWAQNYDLVSKRVQDEKGFNVPYVF